MFVIVIEFYVNLKNNFQNWINPNIIEQIIIYFAWFWLEYYRD